VPFLSALSTLGLKDGQRGSYPELVDVLTLHGAAASHDAHELYRRMVFNVLISNVDDHLRNHGFLWSGRNGWRLSPAYDLYPTPQDVRPRILTTNITLDGHMRSQLGARSKENLRRRQFSFSGRTEPVHHFVVLPLYDQSLGEWSYSIFMAFENNYTAGDYVASEPGAMAQALERGLTNSGVTYAPAVNSPPWIAATTSAALTSIAGGRVKNGTPP